MSQSSWPFARSPTVDDLKVRSCFICRDEHVSTPGVRPSRAEHGFVHPCHCTLIAHERCLLRWMDSGDETRSRCAMCGEQYVVSVPPLPLALRVLNSVSSGAEDFVFKSSIVGIGAGIVVGSYMACASYGYYTARCMLGRKLFRAFFKNPMQWSLGAWLELPVVPIVVAGHVTHPLSYSILASSCLWTTSSIAMRTFPPGVELTASKVMRRLHFDWPPSPGLVALLYPIALVAYEAAYNSLEAWILGGEAALRRPHARPAQGDLRMMFVNIDFEIQVVPAGEGQQARDNIRITKGSVSRTLITLLTIPPLAGFAGSVLRRMARHSRALGAFLAVGEPSKEDYHSWGSYEPVWWHSLVGLAVVAITRDAISLVFKKIQQRYDEKRSIVDFPFVGIDPASIDLQIIP